MISESLYDGNIGLEPISDKCSHFIPLENTRKPLVFVVFSGDWAEHGRNGINGLFSQNNFSEKFQNFQKHICFSASLINFRGFVRMYKYCRIFSVKFLSVDEWFFTS